MFISISCYIGFFAAYFCFYFVFFFKLFLILNISIGLINVFNMDERTEPSLGKGLGISVSVNIFFLFSSTVTIAQYFLVIRQTKLCQYTIGRARSLLQPSISHSFVHSF